MPNPSYSEIELPALVQKANAPAGQIGFPLMPEGRPVDYQGPPTACIPQVGRLLQTLAAGKPNGLIGEIGTGAGVGTAWLASGLAGNAHLVSAEIDGVRAHAVRQLFRDYPQVEIRKGDWHDVIRVDESFDLLFSDAAPRRALEYSNGDTMIQPIKIGGQIVMDDLIPMELRPGQGEGDPDLKREFALFNSRGIGTEVRTTASSSAVILTRIT